MTKPEIHLLDALTEHTGFHSAIYFTYGANLAFFEKGVLHPLWRKGCRNHLVFMDAGRYADTVSDLRGSVTWVGRRYILIPIDLGPLRSFHPKMVLLLGSDRGRLLIGSGNLTFTGFGHNREVYTCLDWTPEQPQLQHLFVQVWDLVDAVFQRWAQHADEVGTMLGKTESRTDWLASSGQSIPEIHLLHTLEEPLIDQCARLLGDGDYERITVVTPFLDDAAQALKEIYNRFRPKELRLILQDQRAVGNVQALEDLRQGGVPLRVYRFGDDERYLHAKVFLFESTDTSYMLTGSANCTRAAWLSTPKDGNVEVMLLRHANRRQHFSSLLKGQLSKRAIGALDRISLRRERPLVTFRESASVRLLGVSVAGGRLLVHFTISTLPEDVTGLQLRLSTTPPRYIPFPLNGNDVQSIQLPVTEDLQSLLVPPLSGSVWGVDARGKPVDLYCNELWITHVDLLRREIGRPALADVRTGTSLADMWLDSEGEWRDLYASLIRLIELEVAGLKRRGGSYTTSPPSRQPRPKVKTEEGEIEIVLVDEEPEEVVEQRKIAEAQYFESQFFIWLEIARSRLPGKPSIPVVPEKEPEPREQEPSGDPPIEPPKRRWTPKEHLRRRFVGLVKEYIRSLSNVEYMQTASIYHILGYYVVFQRIVWLLFQHDVIDREEFVELATDINAGFFGAPDKGPPALCPRLQQHVQRVWDKEWMANYVPAYALGSAIMAGRLVAGDETLRSRAWEQALQVFCGVASVVDISQILGSDEAYVEVANMYDQDVDKFPYEVQAYVESNLSEIAETLEEWDRSLGRALREVGDSTQKQRLYRARTDYGVGRYNVFALLQDAEAQIKLCSDLVFWLRCTGSREAEREWGQVLVYLLQTKGETREVAQALSRNGLALLVRGQHEASAHQFYQALLLAEQVGDEKLTKKYQGLLDSAEFFIR